jgi:hypothetical protein
MANQYVVHGFLKEAPEGKTNEVSCECADLEDVVFRVRELISHYPDFGAITIVHIEDFDALMEGAKPVAAGL